MYPRPSRVFALAALLCCNIFMLSLLRASAAPIEQFPDPNVSIWQDTVSSASMLSEASLNPSDVTPAHYRQLSLNLEALDAVLRQAKSVGEVQAAQVPTVLTLPLPNGNNQNFIIEEYQILDDASAALYPDIKAYQGYGIDDPSATIELTRTPYGFRGMIVTPQRTIFIDPQSNSEYYISYDKRSLPEMAFHDNHEHTLETIAALDSSVMAAALPQAPSTTGDKRHTYRLAIATTGEFTAFYGGQSQARAGLADIVARLNGLFKRELSVEFQLVTNNNILFTNSATDPYDNGNTSAMLNANKGILNNPSNLGANAYDVGHVLGRTTPKQPGHQSSSGRGGIGGSGLCDVDSKASGATVATNPNNPSFAVGTLAHEIGHQFGAGHTFNANSIGSCTGGNYSAKAAVEPGSGTTIMSYKGSCSSQNLPSGNKDDYFHAFTLQEMTAQINKNVNTCGTHPGTGNTPPTVNVGAATYTIPANTMFTINGQGSDADGDPLTYTVDQMDRGKAWGQGAVLPNTDLGDNPIFRSYPPSANSARTFPSLTDANAAKGESLPTTARTLNFRVTARDGKGGVNASDVAVQVVDSAGPFVLTAPQMGTIWTPGAQQTVSWNVANTNQPPFSCSTVDLLYSTDDGKNYQTLQTNVPNNGSATVAAPSVGGTIVLKVQCSGGSQIFAAYSPPPGIRMCAAAFSDDHENGAAKWQTRQWEAKSGGGFSGQSYWFSSTSGFESISMESQQITANDGNLTLSFVHKYSDLKDDNLKVEVKVNQGAWQEIKGFSGASGDSANFPQWTESSVNLSTWVAVNSTFQIRFRHDRGLSSHFASPVAPGWSLDDVFICGTVPEQPPTATPLATNTPTNTPLPTPTPTLTQTPTNTPLPTATTTPGITPPTATPTQTPTNTPTALPTNTPVVNSGPGQAQWTGTGESDSWSDGSNWSGGQAPGSKTDARIPAGLAKYPTINGDAAVRNLSIDTGATINMTAGTLSVYGSWGVTSGTEPVQFCQDRTGGNTDNPNPITFGTNVATDTITIPSGGVLTDLDLFLDLTHTWAGDVVAKLKHQASNTEITVFDPTNDDCQGDNPRFTLDDSATSDVASSCSSNNPAYSEANYKPNEALSAFAGKAYAGIWQLELRDIYPESDNGVLNKWCLNISVENAVGTFVATGGTVRFTGSSDHSLRASADSIFHSLEIGDGSSIQRVTLASDLDINGNLTLANGGQMSAGNYTIELAGNWNQATTEGFRAETSSVVADGTNQTVAGNPLLYNLTVEASSLWDTGTNPLSVSNKLVNNGSLRQTQNVSGDNFVRFAQAGGYLGLIIDPLNSDLGATTVTIQKKTPGCTDQPGQTVQRCFTIEPANKTGHNVSLFFFYDSSEQLSNSCVNMEAYQRNATDGATTKLVRFATECTTATRSTWVDAVSDFTIPNFVLAEDLGGGGARADEAPQAITDAVSTSPDRAITIEVTENDFDPEGGLIFFQEIVDQPVNGQTSLQRGGQLVYTPNEGFTGTDTFTYEIADENDNRTVGTVTVNVSDPSDTNGNDLFLPFVASETDLLSQLRQQYGK